MNTPRLPNMQDGTTPISMAVAKGHIDVVQELLAHKADTSAASLVSQGA